MQTSLHIEATSPPPAPNISPSKRAFEKYKPWGLLFSKFYGIQHFASSKRWLVKLWRWLLPIIPYKILMVDRSTAHIGMWDLYQYRKASQNCPRAQDLWQEIQRLPRSYKLLSIELWEGIKDNGSQNSSRDWTHISRRKVTKYYYSKDILYPSEKD